MSAPAPELLKMLAAQKAGQPGQAPGPTASPMASPQVPTGQREAAMATIGTCLDQMELVLPKLGAETDEGQAVMKALGALSKVFGEHRARMKELAPAQLMQLMQKLPGQMPGGPHPPGAPMPGGPQVAAHPPGLPPMGGPPPSPPGAGYG